MSKSPRLDAIKLRVILVIIFLLLGGVGVAIFMLGYQQITAFSKETQQVSADAEASNSQIQKLTETQKQLEEHAQTVERASQLVAQSQAYQYQDQIINDLGSYAMAAGVQIDTITFHDNASAQGTAAPASTATTDTASTATGTTSPAGIKTTTATVTFKNPLSYKSFLTFIHSLEQGLFRMSISGINITKSTENSDSITSQPIDIEVYIR